MNSALRLLLANQSWAQERRQLDPNFFERFSRVQRPEFLWISCSDSRVVANELTMSDPGEMFVHRNIANVVHDSDANVLAFVQYAVEVLGVRHAIVCGHYGCGGVKAAIDGPPTGLLDAWLRPVRHEYLQARARLDALPEQERWDRLVDLNAVAQVHALARTPIIQAAWRAGKPLYLHAWVYSLQDGLVRPQLTLSADGPTLSTTLSGAPSA